MIYETDNFAGEQKQARSLPGERCAGMSHATGAMPDINILPPSDVAAGVTENDQPVAHSAETARGASLNLQAETDDRRQSAPHNRLPAGGGNSVGGISQAGSMPGRQCADEIVHGTAPTHTVRVDRPQIERSMEGAGTEIIPVPPQTSSGRITSDEVGPQTVERVTVATLRRNVIEAFQAQKAGGLSNESAAAAVGTPYFTIYRWLKAYAAGGFEALMPNGHRAGRKRKNSFSREEAAAVKALVLDTNRTKDSGSTPEALRAAVSRGLLSPGNVELIKSRFEAGVNPLTPVMREQVRVGKMTTMSHRAPRNTWLKFIQSPGSLHLDRDEMGEEFEIEPGRRGTMDDGTINLVLCVPFNLPGNKCSEKYGVMVGRFQFILPVDHRSLFIPGFNFTARPRSSYRAEDLTATLHPIFLEHGFWPEMVLENGISASNLLTETLSRLNIKIHRASSPHQKVVEAVFNRLWTKLSLLKGQVGRFRGEEEEVNSLIESCRSGATDPRKHFMLLADVIKALRAVIAEHNAQLVKSVQYGRWIPGEYWARRSPAHLKRLHANQAFLFSPCIQERRVQGFKARVSVRMMDGHSEVFDFMADFMGDFNGARVKLYFNPFAATCVATVVLAQATWGGIKGGTVLGVAEQVNRMTRFRRRAFGYGPDPDIGLDAAKRNSQALRRSVVSIRADGSTGVQTHEARNGAGEARSVTNDPAAQMPAARKNHLASPSPEAVRERRKRLAEAAEAARALDADRRQ